jgi:hypothetical protein
MHYTTGMGVIEADTVDLYCVPVIRTTGTPGIEACSGFSRPVSTPSECCRPFPCGAFLDVKTRPISVRPPPYIAAAEPVHEEQVMAGPEASPCSAECVNECRVRYL